MKGIILEIILFILTVGDVLGFVFGWYLLLNQPLDTPTGRILIATAVLIIIACPCAVMLNVMTLNNLNKKP